jgi:hypothetical protein
MADVDSSSPELHTATILQFRPPPKPTKAERARKSRNARRNLRRAVDDQVEMAVRAITSAAFSAAEKELGALGAMTIGTLFKDIRQSITNKLTFDSMFVRMTGGAEG